MRGLLATLITLGACAEDPSLRIEVVHDPVVVSSVASTTITVYQSEQFSCEKVEFGDLNADQLLAGFIDEITVGNGDDLRMSRTENKVIVARGFDDDGTLFTAGCNEKATVHENDSLVIDTFRVASVSINGIGLEDGDPFGLVVTVTDPLVVSIPDRAVSWRVHGPFGATPFIEDEGKITVNPTPGSSDWVPVDPPCTNDDGVRRLHPMPPATIGGYATDVRVSWSSDPPRRFTTLTPINDNGRFDDFLRVPNSLHWCTGRIASGIHRMVCLEDRGTPVAIDYKVVATSGGAVFTQDGAPQGFGNFPGTEVPLQVFSVVREDGKTRDAYMLTTKGRVIGLFTPSIDGDGTARVTVPAEHVVDAVVMQECGSSPATLLVQVEDPVAAMPFRELRTMTAHGADALVKYQAPSVPFLQGLAINQTGCVAELRPGEPAIPRQVGVVNVKNRDPMDGPRNSTTAFFDCDVPPNNKCVVQMAVPLVGVGFLAKDDPPSDVDPTADPQKRPERMVTATVDASGIVLSVTVLQPGQDGKPRPVELERVTSAAFPARLDAGRFDGDGKADLFWDIQNGNNSTTNFQIAYALQLGGERLSALSQSQPDMIVIDTVVADVTGDGIDDLIIMSGDALVPTKLQVRVIPSQAPIAADTLMFDSKCNAN